MNDLQLFKYEGNEIRTVVKDGEPWFVAKDVCDVLGLGNSSEAVAKLEEEEKGSEKVDTLGGAQKMIVINESGLYTLVIRSNMPQSKPFRKWVTSEVIPSIRKHGGYLTQEKVAEALLNPDVLIQLATSLKQEREEKLALAAKIEADKPLVLFAETCCASKDSILVRELAKLACKNGVEIGEKRLWQKLREWRVVSGSNEPYQSSFDAGWFEAKQGTYCTPYGSDTYRTYKVTPKGQMYIIERLRREMAN